MLIQINLIFLRNFDLYFLPYGHFTICNKRKKYGTVSRNKLSKMIRLTLGLGVKIMLALHMKMFASVITCFRNSVCSKTVPQNGALYERYSKIILL